MGLWCAAMMGDPALSVDSVGGKTGVLGECSDVCTALLPEKLSASQPWPS